MPAKRPLLRQTATAAALITLLIGGCGPAVKPESAPVAGPASRPAIQAITTNRKGADEYLAMARGAAPPKRQEYQLRAAAAMIDEGRAEEAARLVGVIQSAPLSEELRRRKELVLARIALARGDTETALKQLPSADPTLSDELRAELIETRAEAYRREGNALEAARERLQLEPLLTDPRAVERNRQAIFDTLSQLSVTALETFTLAPPDLLSGWLELVAAHKRAAGSPDELARQLAQWRQRYPGHPGSALAGGEAPTMAARPSRRYPESIALLLPLSGRLAAAGRAVRDGLLAAYYLDLHEGVSPGIRLYDTGGDPSAIWGIYRQAVADGAKEVIGPLDKGAVSNLALAGDVDVPLLALNHVDEATHGTFYQFSLSPEDEARGVAVRAALDGYHRALLLTPQGEWGERVAAAFTRQWEQSGNRVVERAHYDPAEADFSQPIQAMLNLDESEQRYHALRSATHRRMEFEPRRREDVDLIFLAAAPREARLIRPQLRFHQAGDIALYATSQAFSGRIDPDTDRDMDGLVFCDMPWSLPESRSAERDELQALWPEEMDRYGRLFAMGMDAYRLIPYLDHPVSAAALPLFEGATGGLMLEAGNRIHRELRCARFIDGVPVSLRPPADAPGNDPTGVEATDVSLDRPTLIDDSATEAGGGGGTAGPGIPAPTGPEARRP
ncbi:penicillin-binding protein activator [Endothiovibrio diazotrophicus]